MGLGGVVEKVHENRLLEPELSGFGLRISFGSRISSFGFRVQLPVVLVGRKICGGAWCKKPPSAEIPICARGSGAAGEVAAVARRYRELLGAGGGYILGPAHLFQPNVPPENILAVYRA